MTRSTFRLRFRSHGFWAAGGLIVIAGTVLAGPMRGGRTVNPTLPSSQQGETGLTSPFISENTGKEGSIDTPPPSVQSEETPKAEWRRPVDRVPSSRQPSGGESRAFSGQAETGVTRGQSERGIAHSPIGPETPVARGVETRHSGPEARLERVSPSYRRPHLPVSDARVRVRQVGSETTGSRTEVTRAAIEGEAAPLMLHALGVYYSLRYRRGDAPLRSLRARGFRFEDMAAVWMDADRSGRSLEETAVAAADRRDRTGVFQAADAPSADPNALLHDAAERYYVLGAGTVRGLAARGWTLGDVLTAGNLEQRSETSFWQIVALRESGRNWSEVAAEIGVPARDIYYPRALRRATAAS